MVPPFTMLRDIHAGAHPPLGSPPVAAREWPATAKQRQAARPTVAARTRSARKKDDGSNNNGHHNDHDFYNIDGNNIDNIRIKICGASLGRHSV